MSGLYALQTRLIYFPDSRPLTDCHLPAETKLIQTGLERALFTDADSQNLIVFFHGNAGSACNWRYIGANHLAPLGYDTLVVEYPGYAGDPRAASKAEIEQALPVFNAWIADQGYDTVTVFGYSLGSAIGALYVQDYGADQVLLYAPFDSLYAVAVALGYDVPRQILTEDYDNIAALSGSTAPIYIAHGDADVVIAAAHSETLAEALRTEGLDVTRDLLPGKGHEGLFDSPEFDQTMARILLFAEGE